MTRMGWHILPPDRRLRYGDDRTVTVGKRLGFKVVGLDLDDLLDPFYQKPLICSRGMHASPTISSARACWNRVATVSSRDWLCRVEVEGTNYGTRNQHDLSGEGRHKFVGTHRTVLGMIPLDEADRIIFKTLGGKRAKRAILEAMQERNDRNRNSTLVR